MIKTKVLFWRAGFCLANQSNLKSFHKVLIGWKKAGAPKKPLLFWSCNQAKCIITQPQMGSRPTVWEALLSNSFGILAETANIYIFFFAETA